MPSPTSRPADGSAVRARIATIDWASIAAALDAHGHAVVDGLLAAADCASLVGRYDDDPSFRSRVMMARHGFGRGEYKYFADPLPDPVASMRTGLFPPLAAIANAWNESLLPDPDASLRTGLFPPLAAIANAWNESLGIARRYPAVHQRYRALCRAAGQTKPTPLLLRYGAGDYNCLHRDLYGDEVFPLQVAILLSAPGADFSGGEFVLTEQRPRMQSRVEVVPLGRGDAVIFPVNERPVRGTRRPYRVAMRHGVSRLHAGHRHTLGVIFHDAR